MDFNHVAGQDNVPALYLQEIVQDAPERLVSQLAGKDAVHAIGVENENRLRQYRLGGEQFNRSCFAMTDSAGIIHSAIYLHKTYDPVHDARSLSGNVREILHSPCAQAAHRPSSIIFYSISRMTNVYGTGEKLIRDLYANLVQNYAQTVLSTLSPLRQSFETHIDEKYGDPFHTYEPVLKKRIAVEFLQGISDGVQKFHMGNGAIIGDVKLDADSVGKFRTMVNYIYPSDPEELARNAALFRSQRTTGSISSLISGSLLEETGLDSNERRFYALGAMNGTSPS